MRRRRATVISTSLGAALHPATVPAHDAKSEPVAMLLGQVEPHPRQDLGTDPGRLPAARAVGTAIDEATSTQSVTEAPHPCRVEQQCVAHPEQLTGAGARA